jgi:chromosome segregation ATPase
MSGKSAGVETPEVVDLGRVKVDEFLKRQPTSTRDFFHQMEKGFQEAVRNIENDARERVERVLQSVRRVETERDDIRRELGKVQEFVEAQRAEVNRLSEEVVRLRSQQGAGARVPALEAEVARLTHKLDRRRDGEKVVRARDQAIRDLRARVKTLETQLRQARQVDVRAANEALRDENKTLRASLERTVEEAAKGKQEAESLLRTVTQSKDDEIKTLKDQVQIERYAKEQAVQDLRHLERQAAPA